MAMTHKAIEVSATGDATLVINGTTNFRINIYEIYLQVADSVTVRVKSMPYGTGTSGSLQDITGPLFFTRGTALHLPLQEKEGGGYIPHFQTEGGDNLVLHLSAAVSVGGWIKYTIDGSGDMP